MIVGGIALILSRDFKWLQNAPRDCDTIISNGTPIVLRLLRCFLLVTQIGKNELLLGDIVVRCDLLQLQHDLPHDNRGVIGVPLK